MQCGSWLNSLCEVCFCHWYWNSKLASRQLGRKDGRKVGEAEKKWTVWGGGRICKELDLQWHSQLPSRHQVYSSGDLKKKLQPLFPGGRCCWPGNRRELGALWSSHCCPGAVWWSLWISKDRCEGHQCPGSAPTFWAQKENGYFISAFWISNKISLQTRANCVRRRTLGNRVPA